MRQNGVVAAVGNVVTRSSAAGSPRRPAWPAPAERRLLGLGAVTALLCLTVIALLLATQPHARGARLDLDIGLGFLVGLGLGALTGQRTVSTVLMIVLTIIVTPILARAQIPYFINGQRLVVGIAMAQLRPAGLASGTGGGGGPGHVLFGGRGSLEIPPMPTWAMITVIVGWIIGWSVIGAWRMATRDA
jgi:hypothetical protein